MKDGIEIELLPVNGYYDHVARLCFEKNPASRFSWFLSASFCYYIDMESILTDELFDGMCTWLLEHYDEVEHVNKDLVTRDMLRAGSAYNLRREDYPLRVQITGDMLARNAAINRNGLG